MERQHTGMKNLKSITILLLAQKKKLLKKDVPKLKLILVGRVKKIKGEKIDINYKDIIRKQFPTQEGVAIALNAADVAVIPNRVNAFTKYCFPYKGVEYMACNTPIVATAVGDVANILKDYKNSLCRPDDVYDLAEKIKLQLSSDKIDYGESIKDKTWDKIAFKLDKILKA